MGNLKDITSGESQISGRAGGWSEWGIEDSGGTNCLRVAELLAEVLELDDIGELDNDVEVGVFVDVELIRECSND